MKVEFRTSFLRDVSKIKNKAALKQIKGVIERIETENIQSVS